MFKVNNKETRMTPLIAGWAKALLPVGTIVRGSHHHEPSTQCEQDLNLSRGSAQTFMNESCAVVITTTPRRHQLKLGYPRFMIKCRKKSSI